ncbi:uncharacterized protein LOC126834833 [Adelges cooleyi]|uniref:uncharacterized protein LOC126834833 n=1 Tax=Adelges cooleyi TaxID=133065 RepID=UPI00217FDE18|nr:uncharacterized protein LOC126834833 [Adelges cooleyi]
MGTKLIFSILFMLFAKNMPRDIATRGDLIIQKQLPREPIVKSEKQGHQEDSWKDVIKNIYSEVVQRLAAHRMYCNFHLVKMYGGECSESIEQPGFEATIKLMEISDTRVGYLLRLFYNYSLDVKEIFVDYWLFADLGYLWQLYAGSSVQNVGKVSELFSKALGNKFLPERVPHMSVDEVRGVIQQTRDDLNDILDRLQMYMGETRWFTMDNFSLRPLMQSDLLMDLRDTIFPDLDVPLDRCYDEIVRKPFDVDALWQYRSFALRRLDAIVTEEFAYLVAAYGQLLLYEERLYQANEETTRDALIYSTDTIVSYVYIMERLFVGQIQVLWSTAKWQAYQYSCQSEFDYDPNELTDSPAVTIAKKCKQLGFRLSDTEVSVYEWWFTDAEKRIIGTLDPKANNNIDKYMNVLFFILKSTSRVSYKLVAICDALKFPYNVTSFTIKDKGFQHRYTKITLTEDFKQN